MMQLRNGRKRSVAITEELQRFETAMKAMENRSFDWNSVRLQIPSFDKQQPRAMSSFDIPVRHTPQDSLSSPDSEEESILKAVDEEEQPLLRLDQPNGGALQNTKVCISYKLVGHTEKLQGILLSSTRHVKIKMVRLIKRCYGTQFLVVL
ncbi:hypothetical protein KC19_1G051600 [Ceratodon purpureus]|uniref:Uncharacterized protein n=1 Tax=Ceratodon purpureus TaxID=3225 RepID=A0A8T0J400_CERPU|nr:hypothetical protein KC19_1G051600 [Ceratodon purpureus]